MKYLFFDASLNRSHLVVSNSLLYNFRVHLKSPVTVQLLKYSQSLVVRKQEYRRQMIVFDLFFLFTYTILPSSDLQNTLLNKNQQVIKKYIPNRMTSLTRIGLYRLFRINRIPTTPNTIHNNGCKILPNLKFPYSNEDITIHKKTKTIA